MVTEAHYCAKVQKDTLQGSRQRKGIPSINVLNALSVLVDTWGPVTAATISTENRQQSLDDAVDPFQALANETEDLRARDEALMPSEITANEYIYTDDSLFTFETCAITCDEISSEVTSIEDNDKDCEDIYYCEDLIQLPTKYEGCRLWQFCKNAPFMIPMLEMRCMSK